VQSNSLEYVPSEVADLQSLETLDVSSSSRWFLSLTRSATVQLVSNQLRWLPFDFDRLPPTTEVFVREFRFPECSVARQLIFILIFFFS
jgi:hypothetical protein